MESHQLLVLSLSNSLLAALSLGVCTFVSLEWACLLYDIAVLCWALTY